MTAIVTTQADTGGVVPAPEVELLRAWRGNTMAPTRLATSGDGVVYVSDPALGQVVARRPDGSVLFRRSGLGRPLGIAVDNLGNLLVGDSSTGAVTAWNLTTWTEAYHLGAGAGEFGMPADVAVAPDTGAIYVADATAHLIRVYAAGGSPLFTFGGQGSDPGMLDFPVALDIDPGSGSIDVVDHHNHRIQVFAPDGTWLSVIGEYGDETGQLQSPQGIWADASSRLWVTEAARGTIVVFDSAGGMLGEFGEFGATPGQLRLPSDVLIDGSGRLVVASTNNGRLEIFGVDAYSDPESVAPAFVSLDTSEIPREGSFRARIEVPGYRLDEVDDTTLDANGVEPSTVSEGDEDNDGEPELILEFDADALIGALGEDGGSLVFSGQMATLELRTEAVDVTVAPETPVDSAVDSEPTDPAVATATPIEAQGVGATKDEGETGSDAEEGGCACGTTGGPAGAMVLLLGLLAVKRRR